MQRLLHLPRWALRVGTVLAVALACAFIVLTRTEVGRDGVRRGLEAAFARQFDGTLHIERLTGNLVGVLHAGRVVVRGADGAVLLEADSLVLRPTFRGLLSRSFTIRSATVIRPHVYLRHDSTGWNVTRLLRPQRDAERTPPGWSFTTPVIRLVDGTLDLVAAGPIPRLVAAGWLADYRTLHADALDASFRVDLSGTRRQVEIDRFSAHLSHLDLPLEASGVWTAGADEQTLRGLVLSLGTSNLQGDVAWSGSDPAPFDLDGVFNLTELRRLVPALPVRDVVRLDADGFIQRGQVYLTRADIRHEASRVQAAGIVAWDTTGVRLEDATLAGRVREMDLVAVWPAAPPPIRALSDQARFDLAGTAMWHRGTPATEADLRFEYAGAVGGIRGEIQATQGDVWRLSGTVTTAGLDAVRLDPRLGDTELTGTTRLSVSGPSLHSLIGEGSVELAASRLWGRPVDSLAVSGTWTAEAVSLDGHATQDEARWDVHADAARDLTRLTGTVGARRGQLRTLVPALRHEAVFTGTSTFELALDRRPAGTVRLDLDALTVTRDTVQATFAPVTAQVSLQEDGALQANLDTDAARIALGGHAASADPLGALRAWQEIGVEALDRLLPPSRSSTSLALHLPPSQTPRGRLQAQLTATVMDAKPLRVLHPALQRLGETEIRADVEADSSVLTLHADATLSAPQLTRAASDSLSLSATLTLSADAHLDALLTATADTLRLGGVLPDAHVRLVVEGRDAHVRLRSRAGDEDAARFVAHYENGFDAARITVDTLALTAGPYQLETSEAQRLFAYRDALVLPSFGLETAGGAGGLLLRGTLSASTRDTLYATMKRVPLSPVTARLGPRFRFGGNLDADVALTGGLARPELTGRIDARGLTWGRYVVGDVGVESFYAPGTPDVALALAVVPAAPPPAGFVPVDNRVRVEGTFRLPSLRDPGALDLAVTADSADAFFFDNLFPGFIAGATGRIGGDGHIGGTFRRPIFEADMEIVNARFRIPAFNLTYRAAGRALVDAEGIHVRDGVLRDNDGGVARLDGSILFNDYRFFSLDVQGRLDRLAFLNVAQSPDLAFYGRMRASGDARLTGPLSAARLVSNNAVLTDESEVFIPIRSSALTSDPGYVIFADSSGRLPDLRGLTQRTSVIGKVEGERSFTGGLEMDLNLQAPPGVTVNLVTDPLAGDVMRAVGSGRVQLLRRDGDFFLFGALDVTGGDYLFTAGDVFVRRFDIDSGTIDWDGDPLDPTLDVQASYQTRASLAGTPYAGAESRFVPLHVRLDVQDRLSALSLGLHLEVDRSDRGQALADLQEIEQFLNQPDRQAEYATSVLLTNSFLLTTSLTDPGATESLSSTGNRFAFASLSQLVATQLNRYLSAVLPGVDFNLGVQGERANDLDLTYGIALRLLDERLVIRGAGLLRSENTANQPEGLQGEFVVEVRLSNAVSVEVFYRREEDILQRVVTSSTGAGLSYNTRFTSWSAFWRRLTGQKAPTDRFASQ